MSVFMLTFILTGCSQTAGNSNDIILNTDKFITCLFENKLEKAGELSLGIVKFNVLSNKTDFELEKGFNIEDIKLEPGFVSDNLAIVNSAVSYVDNVDGEYNMVFYEIRLLKEENEWRVYCLNETDPLFENKGNRKTINPDTLNKKDFEKIFCGYTENLSNNRYQEASKYLIGRAKKMHKKANPALGELNLVNDITELNTKVICAEKDNVVVRFDYKNNDKPMSVLVYFYLTGWGWRIYNVNQI